MRCNHGIAALAIIAAFIGCLPVNAGSTSQPTVKPVKVAAAKPAAKRAARHGHARSGRRVAAGFIPPPPAYMPSILPEIAARRAYGQDVADGVEEVKPENPYAKYIYNRQGEAPTALQTRKGVVTWARKS